MDYIPMRITLTRSQGFDHETARLLGILAVRTGEDPRFLAARLLRDALVALSSEEYSPCENASVLTDTEGVL